MFLLPLQDAVSVLAFGAKGSGGDDTGAIQRALDSLPNGGVVSLPAGRYGITHLTIPDGVTLRGTGRYATATNGLRDGGAAPKPGAVGSWLYVLTPAGARQGDDESTEDARRETITIRQNAGITGIAMYWPGQSVDEAPKAFPWAVKIVARNGFVTESEMLNPYQGVWCDSERALVRDLHGQAIRNGLRVDNCGDISRWENVHWNPWFSFQKGGRNTALFDWQARHGTAFEFLRSDSQNVLQCFAFGYARGFAFLSSAPNNAMYGISKGGRALGATYAALASCGADVCRYPVYAEQTQSPQGVHFSGFTGIPIGSSSKGNVRGVGIYAGAGHGGTLSFTGGAFWGGSSQIADWGGGALLMTGVSFTDWDGTKAAIGVRAGRFAITGCDFRQKGDQLSAVGGVAGAFTGNLCAGGVKTQVPAGVVQSANVGY